jgi:hypothetical protein
VRTSILPDLSGRGAAAAKAFMVAGPATLLVAGLTANLPAGSGTEAALLRLAGPLMLAWAAVLFLVTRVTAPVAAWTGLVAVTLQVTLVREATQGGVVIAVESVGFIAFAMALGRQRWVPRVVPVLFVAFPVVALLTPDHANPVQLIGFAAVVAVGLVLAIRLRSVDEPDRIDRSWGGRQEARLSVRSAGQVPYAPVNQRVLPPIG